MSKVFCNRAASELNDRIRAEIATIDESHFSKDLDGHYAWMDAQSAVFHKHTDENAREIGVSNLDEYYFSMVFRSLPRSESGWITDIQDAIALLRQAYRIHPKMRDRIVPVGQWLHTVSEFR